MSESTGPGDPRERIPREEGSPKDLGTVFEEEELSTEGRMGQEKAARREEAAEQEAEQPQSLRGGAPGPSVGPEAPR